MGREKPKKVRWIGSSYDDWKTFPAEVQDVMGYALYLAGHIHGKIQGHYLCAACFPEKIEERHFHTKKGNPANQATTETGKGTL